MQNKPNNNTKALEALISDNEATNIAFFLQTILMGYLTSDSYCQSPEKERSNFVYAAQQTIDLFRYLGPIGSKDAQENLNQFLNSIEPSQAGSVWNEALFGFVQMDDYCERHEMDRWCLVHTARSVINYFNEI